MNITDVPQSGIYLQRASVVQLIVQLIDNNTGEPVQLQGASSLTIALLYPDRSTYQTFSASLYTDGSDGRIVYATVNDGSSQVDLSQVGLYGLQGQAVIGSIPTPWSEGPDFYVLPNAVDQGTPPPPIYTASALIMYDADSVRWAITVSPSGIIVATAQSSGPTSALTLRTMTLQDSDGIYWTYTISTDGDLVPNEGGSYQGALDRLTLMDSAGITWVLTPTVDTGELVAA